MKLNEKIWNCRKKAGLSQEELGERVGVSRQAVSKWETGESAPEISKLKGLAEVFGTTVDWLLSEESVPVEEPIRQTAPGVSGARSEALDLPVWIDSLPRQVRGLIRSYGWLGGIYLAVVGAGFSGMGLLSIVVVDRMFSMPLGSFDGSGIIGGQDPFMTSFVANNPVTFMGKIMLGFGLILFVGGILLALLLKRWGQQEQAS